MAPERKLLPTQLGALWKRAMVRYDINHERANIADLVDALRATCFPKQVAFVDETSRHALFSGGFAAGKTYAGLVKLVQRAAHPGALEGLCHQRLVDLKGSALRMLLEREGDRQPILPPGSYDHQAGNREIHLHGGGVIRYFGVTDSSKARGEAAVKGGFNLTGCLIDEATKLNAREYRDISARIRVKGHPLGNQVYSTCNPDSPFHHLGVRFGTQGQALPNHIMHSAASSDNPHLSQETLDDYNTMTGIAHQRLVQGLWVAAEGLVYQDIQMGVQLIEREGPWKRTIIGVDDGHVHPFVLIVLRVDSEDRMHAEAAHYRRGSGRAAKIYLVKSTFDALGDCQSIEVDPSAAELIAELRAADLPARPADNSLKGAKPGSGGIERVRTALAGANGVQPRLTISPNGCGELIAQLLAYRLRAGSDDPIKESDDGPDALRYAVARATAPPARLYTLEQFQEQFQLEDDAERSGARGGANDTPESDGPATRLFDY